MDRLGTEPIHETVSVQISSPYTSCSLVDPLAHQHQNAPVTNLSALGVELGRNEDLKKVPSPLETTTIRFALLKSTLGLKERSS